MTMKTTVLGVIMAGVSALVGGCVGEPSLEPEDVGSESSAVNPPEVELLFANITESHTPGSGGQCPCTYHGVLSGFVEVENLGFSKEVVVHYTAEADPAVWKDASATYFGPAGGSRELWYFETDEESTPFALDVDFRFAVRYSVNGNTYWDNNGGWNHCAGAGQGPYGCPGAELGKNALTLTGARYEIGGGSAATRLSGEVLLKSLAYDKTVKVVYTTDGWSSSSTAFASHAGAANAGEELWQFAPVVPAAAEIEFAIAYEVNGQTIWDNNVGRNYRLQPNTAVYLGE